MKKIVIILLLLLSVSFSSTYASHYSNFEELEISEGKLLEDYTSKDFKKHYRSVTRRKFFGWRTKTVNKRVEISYTSETIFSYYNDGYTAINYEYKLDQTSVSKFNFSSTGTIGVKANKTTPGFKGGLDSSLKISGSYNTSDTKKESYKVDLKVDPGTKVDLYIYGEGKITNGVAAKYAFWFRRARGGFEYFEITTQYPRLEKVRI